MVQLDPALGREQPAEVGLHPVGGGAGGEAQAPGHPEDVGVHRQGGDAEGVGQDHVGGLGPHSREPGQQLPGGGHLAAMALHQGQGQALEILGLGPEEAGGADERFHFGGVPGRQTGRIGEAPEEGRGGEVHPGVGALGAEHRGHHQLVRVPVVQGAPGVRVGLAQTLQELRDGGGGHGVRPCRPDPPGPPPGRSARAPAAGPAGRRTGPGGWRWAHR